MLSFDVSSDVDRVMKALREDARQVPFAASRAINRAAFLARDAIERQMPIALDRPTRYTIKSLRVVRSDKRNLSAAIDVKNTPTGQRPADNFLLPNVEGFTARRQKALERFLISRNVIPPGAYLVPTDAAAKDANGNWKRSQIRQIAIELGIAIDAIARKRLDATQTRRMAKGAAYKPRAQRFFVIQDNTEQRHLEPGIYRRLRDNSLEPIAIIKTSAPRYRRRLAFYDIAHNIVTRNFPKLFEEELIKAINNKK